MSTSRPLRICIFTRVMRRHRSFYLPPFGILAGSYVKMGHQVTMLTTMSPDGAVIDQESFAECHYLAGTRPNRVDDAFWKASARQFDKLHAERPFDVVMGRGVWHWGFFQYSRFADEVPVIAHEGTYPRWLHQVETRFPQWHEAIIKPIASLAALRADTHGKAMQRANRVVCNSPALARAMRLLNPRNPPNTTFIPYGFELSRYDVLEPSSVPRLVFLGRLARDKGLFTLIDTLAALPRKDVIVEAVGPVDEALKKKLVRYADARGVAERFVMPGPVPNSDVGKRLTGATAFVFASTHNEGLPKVVMEAMAAGLPVVAYALPGMDTLVSDGVTGYLAPPRDDKCFRKKVEELLSDPARAVSMGLEGRRRVETEFDPNVINEQWASLFSDVLEEATPH